MFEFIGRIAAIRTAVLAGSAAVALGGLGASVQAMPVAVPAIGGAEAVQYYDQTYPHHGHRRRHHESYGMNAHPRHPGHAGLYDCGPGGKATRLSRRACGGNNRFQHLQRGY